ncbi:MULTISPECIES: type II toxin-antitoxin system VapB family antitoxin [unclassified Nocardioides]|uniref:type II toxin-antitoxin system VapB family antitoxin n=1 Tax=unclassified Nocardioides TaxID=2615069 RepID=UPI0011509268|nr:MULTISPECIES: type II toxin-antitoxin system VapB family antitoxin [unclassified Nocardioides]TQK72332.1 Arc/MetJ family transcription regulator [Nocardioides sp. SLBN-35]WGY03460.1 type II toxin-antitoxin system VapB family antitoxin [Nocardioides sp. QY071]
MTKTLIDVDEGLMAEAMAATGQPTKRGTVTEALEQVVRKARALEYLEHLRSGIASELDDAEVVAQAQR